jgi:predicted TIM-barrel fold metal-dependent hydrolase
MPHVPAIDAHNHISSWMRGQFEELSAIMDDAGVSHVVDLLPAWGNEARAALEEAQAVLGDRLVPFLAPAWAHAAVDTAAFVAETVDALRRATESHGIKGLKIYKEFGLRHRDDRGRLIAVDDARIAPLWEAAAELEIPVLIHVADPVAFFKPLDRFNERWEELSRNPSWHFYGPPFPSFDELMRQFRQLLAAHPQTTFIGAHVGCYPENLGWVAETMDLYPNYHADISARAAELGRQPFTARKFFIEHADRLLFGTDSRPNVGVYRVYYRLLETDDEYFPYKPHGRPTQGRWNIYGLNLPGDVLEKVYRGNAERLIGL